MNKLVIEWERLPEGNIRLRLGTNSDLPPRDFMDLYVAILYWIIEEQKDRKSYDTEVLQYMKDRIIESLTHINVESAEDGQTSVDLT